jgi:hypothetical protein
MYKRYEEPEIENEPVNHLPELLSKKRGRSVASRAARVASRLVKQMQATSSERRNVNNDEKRRV